MIRSKYGTVRRKEVQHDIARIIEERSTRLRSSQTFSRKEWRVQDNLVQGPQQSPLINGKVSCSFFKGRSSPDGIVQCNSLLHRGPEREQDHDVKEAGWPIRRRHGSARPRTSRYSRTTG
jgi:hypothetical protein